MVDLLTTLGRTMGFSFAAGINLYATVAILGLSQRLGWVTLPDQFRAFDNNVVIGAAVVMYVIEFFADKIPWVDSLWDAVHTVIRPVGGALIAVTALGQASPTVEGLVALLGGTLAAGTHLPKSGTGAVAHTSPGSPAMAAFKKAGYRRLPRAGMTFVVRRVEGVALPAGAPDPLVPASWSLSLGDLELF